MLAAKPGYHLPADPEWCYFDLSASHLYYHYVLNHPSPWQVIFLRNKATTFNAFDIRNNGRPDQDYQIIYNPNPVSDVLVLESYINRKHSQIFLSKVQKKDTIYDTIFNMHKSGFINSTYPSVKQRTQNRLEGFVKKFSTWVREPLDILPEIHYYRPLNPLTVGLYDNNMHLITDVGIKTFNYLSTRAYLTQNQFNTFTAWKHWK